VTIPDKEKKMVGIIETQIGTVPLIPMRKSAAVCMEKAATRKDIPLNFFLVCRHRKNIKTVHIK
jgi:hypothetical protein